jgi:hypothetical protein
VGWLFETPGEKGLNRSGEGGEEKSARELDLSKRGWELSMGGWCCPLDWIIGVAVAVIVVMEHESSNESDSCKVRAL